MKDHFITIKPQNTEDITNNQLYVKEFRLVRSGEEFIFDFTNDFASGYLIFFFRNGQGILIEEDKYRYFNQDQMLVIKGGQKIKVSNHNCAYYILQIDGPNVEAIIERLIETDRKGLITVLNPEKVKVIFSRIEASLQKRYQPHKLTSHIFSILSEFDNVEVEVEKNSNEDLITKAIALIEERFSEDLNVDEIAKVANLSKFYFTKEFKKITGMTPIQYLIRKRINHAEFLLENTNQSVFQISSEAGFNTEVNFFYHFRKANSCTPNEYRKIHRNKWS